MTRIPTLRPATWLVIGLSVACGGDAISAERGTPGQPGITVESGTNVTDTVDAILPAPLRVVVRDSSGMPVPNTSVRLSASLRMVPIWPSSEPTGSRPTVRLGSPSVETPSESVTLVTSSDGSVSVPVRLGEMAGNGAVDVEVLATGETARATFTILPGAAVELGVSPRDSAMVAGGSLALQTAVLDRHANLRSGTASLRSLNPSATISSTAVLSASDPGRVAIEVTNGAIKPETAWVSVVPNGTFAARRGTTLTLQHLDGSDFRIIFPELPFDLSWSSADSTVLTQFAFTIEAPEGLYKVRKDGSRTRIAGPGTTSTSGSVLNLMFDTYAAMPDGGVAVALGECPKTKVLYRLPPNGATPIRLAPQVPDASVCVWHQDRSPSPSPDGTRLAFENDSVVGEGYFPHIWTMDAATGTATPLNVTGMRPSWSTVDDRIAYTAGDRIWVINADGTGARAISPAGQRYLDGVSWSPDGAWLLAFEYLATGGSRIVVLNVATGMALPLSYTVGDGTGAGYDRPVWTTLP
jgi:hypothetical protein